jgi:hypothetical protein
LNSFDSSTLSVNWRRTVKLGRVYGTEQSAEHEPVANCELKSSVRGQLTPN